MTSAIIFRRAVPLDCANIVRLMLASWDSDHAAGVLRVNDQRAIEYVADLLKNAHVVVADVSGRLIGALACALMRERWSGPDDWFLVDELFVISSHWVTRGIPERLLQEAEEFADEERIPLLLGGSLMTSFPLDSVLSQRPNYQRLGAQYLRMPRVGPNDGIEQREAVSA